VLVGNRVESELTGEEVPRPVGERSRLEAAVEVQLECVDSLEAKLRRADRGQAVGPPDPGQALEQRVVCRPELDGVAIGRKPRRVAGGRAPDQVKRPGDDEKRHGAASA
jgi:hypothetical protein